MTNAGPHYRQEIDDRFRIIADMAPVLMRLSDTNKVWQFFNKGWLEFTGRTLEEELDNGWMQGVHPDDCDRYLDSYASHFDARKPFEIEYRLKRCDGEYRWVIDKEAPRYDADGSFAGFVGSCTDIHDSKTLNDILEEKIGARTAEILRQAKELKDRTAFADTLFNASVDVNVVYDKKLNFLAVNDAAKHVYGFDDEVIGKNLLDIYPKAKGSKGYKDVLLALKGETIHNSVYKSAVTDIYFENFLIPLKKDGDIYAVLVIARDISQRIRSELELKQLNERLVSQNTDLQSSNEDLESFNYIASHDLQEPLRKVNMFASRIQERDGSLLSPQSIEYFGRITSAIGRMQNLIQSLLAYSSTNAADIRFARTDLNKILKEVKLSLEEVIREKNAVIGSGQLPSISAIPLQIQQLLHNLVSNALKYSKPDVAPDIRITAETVSLAERRNKEFWKISVADNGIGFDPAYKQKIFDLFHRLHGKTEYEGTGIGLAICRKIAAMHNGFITADASVGKGAVFSVFIPVKK